MSIFRRLGQGENNLGIMTPHNYTTGDMQFTPNVISLGYKMWPYIIIRETVLCPFGRIGMLITLVKRAIEMVKAYNKDSLQM